MNATDVWMPSIILLLWLAGIVLFFSWVFLPWLILGKLGQIKRVLEAILDALKATPKTDDEVRELIRSLR